MGHINLSPKSVHVQDIRLADDARSADPVAVASIDHFWHVVVTDYLDKDIAQTGNDHRFNHDHPFVAREIGIIDRKILDEMMRPPPGMQGVAGMPSAPPIVAAGVPEPGAGIMLVMGIVATMLVRRAKGRMP